MCLTCTVPSSWPSPTTGGSLHRQVHRILDGFFSDCSSTSPVLPSRTWHKPTGYTFHPRPNKTQQNASLHLTCSLLQWSGADTIMLLSLNRTSEFLFRKTAEDMWSFLVSHNCKIEKYITEMYFFIAKYMKY